MSGIDLSQLPAPAVVETLEHTAIRDAMLADLSARDAALAGLLPSDPAYKVIEVAAYREMLLRQRVNDAARDCMLAYAGGADLDNLVALLGVQRLVIDAGDPNANPPVPPTYESDAALRARALTAPDAYSTAGPVKAYVHYALSADGQVKDASVESPTPGQVRVTVLSIVGDGTPAQALLDTVAAALSEDDVRPLTDQVSVQGATIVPYAVTATLYLEPGADPTTTLNAAQAYTDAQHRLGATVALSGLYAALHTEGVRQAVLTSPAADIIAQTGEAPYATALTLTQG